MRIIRYVVRERGTDRFLTPSGMGDFTRAQIYQVRGFAENFLAGRRDRFVIVEVEITLGMEL